MENNELYNLLKEHIEEKDNNKYLDKFATLFLALYITSTLTTTMQHINKTLKDLGVIKENVASNL